MFYKEKEKKGDRVLHFFFFFFFLLVLFDMHRFSSFLFKRLHHACNVTTLCRPETIYALSTSPGKAGVAVIRVSGKSAKKVKSSRHIYIYDRQH